MNLGKQIYTRNYYDSQSIFGRLTNLHRSSNKMSN